MQLVEKVFAGIVISVDILGEVVPGPVIVVPFSTKNATVRGFKLPFLLVSMVVANDAVVENNATESFQSFTAGLWSSTDAITQITLILSGGNVVQYSSASLYGIKNS